MSAKNPQSSPTIHKEPTMKRHPYLRILFLFVTCAAFFFAPFAVSQIEPQVIPVLTKPSELPFAGNVFPIAGQEEVEPNGLILRAQDEAEVGELVRLDASESEVDGITWQILPDTSDFEVIEDGRRAFFSAREESAGKSFLIIVAGAKGGTPYLKHHTLKIKGEPAPPKPETVASKVKRWAASVEDYAGKAEHAKALAGVFRKLAEADDVTVDDMLDATATANTAVLGADLDKWLPLLEPLGEELDTLTEAGELNSRGDYKEVWLLIAEGIEQAI